MDSTPSYAIEASRVALLGRRLQKLALFGEVLAVAALIGGPYVLARIAKSADPDRGFIGQLVSLYTGVVGPTNVYAALLALLQLLMIDVLRRVGGSLAGNDPFGGRTARLLDVLIWLVMAFGIVMAVRPELEACLQAPAVKYGFNLPPLLAYAIVAAVLGVLRAFVLATHALKTENEAFV